MINQLDSYHTNKESLLVRITQVLFDDERTVAAWLTGSHARGNADALSDLDLTVVISNEHSSSLCRRIEQVSSQTSPERLALFSQFGSPAVIHENNNNAPDSGTFTFILYAQSSLMVDWILVPLEKAHRPHQSLILFEKFSIPTAPPVELESLDVRVKRASEMVAFFWMMLAVTTKYFVRQDQVFVTQWLEVLHGLLHEVTRLVAGTPWEYQRGSLSTFEPTLAGQRHALLQLGERMEMLLPEISRIGGNFLPSPMSEIHLLLNQASTAGVPENTTK